MQDTVHPPLIPSPSARSRRVKVGALVVFVLVLPVAGLLLAARTALRDNHALRDTPDELARLASDYQGASPSGSLGEFLTHPDVIPTHDHPLLGQQAPEFELIEFDGKTWNLRELLADGPVVLIFYYGYYCNHCVRQLFDVNRDLPLFREAGARVVAISADPPELTWQRFQQYGPFAFPVLSDPGNDVAHSYRVFRADLLRHGTFLIDRKGTVRWVNVGDAPFRRNPALLYQLAKMEGRDR
jgi:peroxiredoxin